mmetsp:Transcript_33729/g.94756  ORF Transcript_33729/g.94756 Transcript_33729/m.94756 type:complete len:292 (+) Transcript_33729:303-1178(+)
MIAKNFACWYSRNACSAAWSSRFVPMDSSSPCARSSSAFMTSFGTYDPFASRTQPGLARPMPKNSTSRLLMATSLQYMPRPNRVSASGACSASRTTSASMFTSRFGLHLSMSCTCLQLLGSASVSRRASRMAPRRHMRALMPMFWTSARSSAASQFPTPALCLSKLVIRFSFECASSNGLSNRRSAWRATSACSDVWSLAFNRRSPCNVLLMPWQRCWRTMCDNRTHPTWLAARSSLETPVLPLRTPRSSLLLSNSTAASSFTNTPDLTSSLRHDSCVGKSDIDSIQPLAL